MVEMKVFGLALDEDSKTPVLILKDMGEKRVLPIWIGTLEAMAISLVLNEVELPRPMTHDLLLSIVASMDGKITSVDVVSLLDGTYYAELEVERDGTRTRIDCRPSDGIALALRAGAPISVSPEVLDQAEADKKPEAERVAPPNDPDTWTELLEKMSPGTKYKM